MCVAYRGCSVCGVISWGKYHKETRKREETFVKSNAHQIYYSYYFQILIVIPLLSIPWIGSDNKTQKEMLNCFLLQHLVYKKSLISLTVIREFDVCCKLTIIISKILKYKVKTYTNTNLNTYICIYLMKYYGYLHNKS